MSRRGRKGRGGRREGGASGAPHSDLREHGLTALEAHVKRRAGGKKPRWSNRVARETLARLTSEQLPEAELLRIHGEALSFLRNKNAQRVLEVLHARASHDTLAQMMEELGASEHARLMPSLARAYASRPSRARLAIVCAVERIAHRGALPLLRAASEDVDPALRAAAFRAMGEVLERRDLYTLHERYDAERERQVREAILGAMARLEQRFPASAYAEGGALSVSAQQVEFGALSVHDGAASAGDVSLYHEVAQAMSEGAYDAARHEAVEVGKVEPSSSLARLEGLHLPPRKLSVGAWFTLWSGKLDALLGVSLIPLLGGAVMGGVTGFLWGVLSWVLLGIHAALSWREVGVVVRRGRVHRVRLTRQREGVAGVELLDASKRGYVTMSGSTPDEKVSVETVLVYEPEEEGRLPIFLRREELTMISVNARGEVGAGWSWAAALVFGVGLAWVGRMLCDLYLMM